MNTPVRVLIVEDSEDDAKLALRVLRSGGFAPTHRRVQTAAEMETALAQERWDAVISDFQMPGFTGMDALGILRASGLEIPFILISGTIGEETAVAAMKAGASDYVMKTSLTRLAPALARELIEARARVAHHLAREALTDSENRFRQMAENIRDVFFLDDAIGKRILYVSPAYEEIWGRSCASLYADPDTWGQAIHADDRRSTFEKYKQGMKSGSFALEYRVVRPDASIRWVEARGFPVLDASGRLVRIAGIAKDITESKRAESKIKRLNRVYAVLSGINTLIVRVRDRDELFREACRVAVEAGAFKLAWIGVIDPQTLDGRIVAWSGGEQGFIDRIKLTMRDDLSESERPACRALRLGQAVICNDIATDPALSALSAGLLGRGYHALGSFPMSVEGKPVAVIALFAGERDFFDAEEIALLLEMAGNLSFALNSIESGKRIARLDVERKRDEEALRRFSATMDAIDDAIFLIDRASMRFIHVNDAACRIEQRTREDLLASDPWSLLPTSRGELERIYDAAIASAEAPAALEILRQGPDGSPLWLEFRRHAQCLAGHWTIATLVRDITERKRAEARIADLNRVHAVLSGINALIVRVHDRETLFREACRIAVEAGGFRMAWIGIVDSAMKLVPVASAGVTAELLSAIKDRFSSRESVPPGTTMTEQALSEKITVIANDSQNDQRLAFPKEHAEAGIRSLAILPLLVADEAVGVLVLYAGEIEFFQGEELKLLTELAGDIAFAIDHLGKQDRLDYLAYYDEITGLANRRLFLERVAQYARSAASGGHQLAVFLTDIEGFKNINDSLGRPAGDELLCQVSAWMTRNAGDASLVARVGADVFAVVMPKVRPEGDLAGMLGHMIDAFHEHTFYISGGVYRIAARGGVAIYPDDAADADALFRNAEAALKKAKAGGVRYRFYTPEMTESVAGRLTLENELRRALDNGEFQLHYQPKVSCATGKVTGFEALLRWQHPLRGLVGPMEFVPMLEESGLIVAVGSWVLTTACVQARRWHDEGLGVPSMAVNVSGRQIDLSDLCATVGKALAASGLAPACLELEFTEGQLMKNAEEIIDLLRRLKAIGVNLSVDDFGTGYSSLAYLKRFPIDCLKVDRAFVRDITADPDDVSITRAIITLAHSLKLKVVAEGVETEGQLGLLIANHCDEVQGYYFSRPLPAEEATALLRAGRSLDSRMMAGMKQSRTLLLVDDEANILSALKRLLRKDGYDIITACSGDEGLELLASHPVDVIVSDQRMPGMSGVEFLRRVKILHPETVRLVLSGYTDLKSVTDAINEGAIYKFLTKPWDDEVLRTTIREAFRNKEIADESRSPPIEAAALNAALRNLPAGRGAAIDA